MSHLLAFLLCLSGFAGLAFAVHRQQRDVLGRSLPLAMTWTLRVFGACALLFALAVVGLLHGAGIYITIGMAGKQWAKQAAKSI